MTTVCGPVHLHGPPPQPRDLIRVHGDRAITLDEVPVLVAKRLVLDPGEPLVAERRAENLRTAAGVRTLPKKPGRHGFIERQPRRVFRKGLLLVMALEGGLPKNGETGGPLPIPPRSRS
jgi:hypothetical protein